MTITAMTVLSERWLDEVLLKGQILNVGGAPMTEDFSLPAGMGDVAVMWVMLDVNEVASPPLAATAARGARVVIYSSDTSTAVDIVGVGEWMLVNDSSASFQYEMQVESDPLALWRQGELLRVVSPEMDSDVTPTGDLLVRAKVVRVKHHLMPGRGTSQLVR